MAVKHNWTWEEILEMYNKPFMDLLYEAASIHGEHHDVTTVQVSTLLSKESEGRPEDCGYCPQAAGYHSDLKGNDLMSMSRVRAKAARRSRVCMGAAWRSLKDGEEFDKLLTTSNPDVNEDMEMFKALGLNPQKRFVKKSRPESVSAEDSKYMDLEKKPKWLRPGHLIERNLEAQEKAIAKISIKQYSFIFG